jgi:putative transposase
MGCFLISKLNKNAVLYALPEKKEKQRGRPSIYGQRLDLLNLGQKYLVKTEQDKGVLHQIYQLQARNKSYMETTLNIVVIQTRKVKEEKVSLTIIFSNDLSLDAHTLIDYYSLRFQIEFDFRDAKQYFGLSDFKNYQEKNVENFTNMIFTMTLISKKILQDLQKEEGNEKFSLLDLKLLYHGQFQAQNIIYILQNDPDLIFNPNILQKITLKGYINAA